MASERRTSFTLGVALRAAAVGVLAFAVTALIAHGFYASALVTVLVVVLVVLDLRRAVGKADADVGRFLESLGSESPELPARMPRDFDAFAGAARQALARIRSGRAERERRIDWLQGLIDTVPAALVVLGPGEGVALANRAARRLVGVKGRKLDRQALFGKAGDSLDALPPGGRNVLRLVGGETVLASVSRFTPLEGEPCRLVALQRVSGDLDAVEQKAWRDLVRILAHEMMNSLTPIVSLSEALRPRTGADPETAEALEVIARRSTGLMAFVERYRALAELPEPRLQPFLLDHLLADVERLLAGEIARLGARLSISIEPARLELVGDRNLLEQAVLNLVKNALEAADPNDPQVRLEARQAEDRVVLAVGDNGPGVPEAALETIFVPFFTTKPGGSGVGLSLARQIAVAHGGAVEVGPQSPKGSVFRLVLPQTAA